MTSTILIVCGFGVPAVVVHLHRTARRQNAAETLAAVVPMMRPSSPVRLLSVAPQTVPPAKPTPPGAAGGTSPLAAVAPASQGGATPDLQPEVTPSPVKAGEVRRAQGPPCHGCHCCDVYATRIHSAQLEIERLQDEILARDAHGIRHSGSRLTSRPLSPLETPR